MLSVFFRLCSTLTTVLLCWLRTKGYIDVDAHSWLQSKGWLVGWLVVHVRADYQNGKLWRIQFFFTKFQRFSLQRSWRRFRTPNQPLDTPTNRPVYTRICTGIGRFFESGGRKAQNIERALHIGTLTSTCISFSCFVRFF